MRMATIDAGYVGLVSVSPIWHHVIYMDGDEEKIAQLGAKNRNPGKTGSNARTPEIRKRR
jgi:UDP-glucose 6-dehydrogenase